MKNYIRENWPMLFAMSLICVVICVVISIIVYAGFALNHAAVVHEQNEQSRQAWFQRHSCKPIGYTGKSDRIYKCDDGLEYIWRDLPTMKSEQ